MKSLAVIDSELATRLMGQLGEAGIACETRPAIEESGMAATELLVQEPLYDAACVIVNAWWDQELRDEGRVCPKCLSPQMEKLAHERVELALKCRDCGHEILIQV